MRALSSQSTPSRVKMFKPSGGLSPHKPLSSTRDQSKILIRAKVFELKMQNGSVVV